MLKHLLRDLGLTETEAIIYLELLTLGTTSAGKIVEQTNLHRKNLYDALNRLIEKGLVTYCIENKIKYFQAKNPENLLRFLQEKKQKINTQQHDLEQALPLFKAQFNTHLSEIESKIYHHT